MASDDRDQRGRVPVLPRHLASRCWPANTGRDLDRSRRHHPLEVPIDSAERLQRVLAARGVGSRRRAEALIVAGRVAIDGRVVTELGTKIDPRATDLRVDGKLLRPQALRYLLLNKPAGYITTTSDERGRRTVMDLVPTRERIFPVGRLDRDTEGLLLLTNDGDVANRVMHPRYALAKEYQVLTTARPAAETMERVRAGVTIDERRVVPDEFRLVRETRDGFLLTIVIHEGMFHVVRRMMEAVGVPVATLRRTRLGPLSVTGIPVGGWRELTLGERSTLFEALRLDRDGAGPSVGRPASGPGRRPSSAPPPSRPASNPRATPPPAASGDAPRISARKRQSPGSGRTNGENRGDSTPPRHPRGSGRPADGRRGAAPSPAPKRNGKSGPAEKHLGHKGDEGNARLGRERRDRSPIKSAGRRTDADDRRSVRAGGASSPRPKRRTVANDAADDRRKERGSNPKSGGGFIATAGRRQEGGGKARPASHAAGQPPTPRRRADRQNHRHGGRPLPRRDGGDEGEQRDAALERTEP